MKHWTNVLTTSPGNSSHPSISMVTWYLFVTFPDGFSEAKSMEKPGGKVINHSAKLLALSPNLIETTLGSAVLIPQGQQCTLTLMYLPLLKSNSYLPARMWVPCDFLTTCDSCLTMTMGMAKIANTKWCRHVLLCFMTASLNIANSSVNYHC